MTLGNRLEAKVAIVVGGGQTAGATIGNGRATAIRFAEEGATVLVADRDLASAEETVRQITVRGGVAEPAHVEVTEESSCAALLAGCIHRHGRSDVLHTNVGIGAGDSGPSHITEEVWDRILAVNLKGPLFTNKHALPHLRQRGSGVLLAVGSVASVCAVGIVAYKSSKAALDAMYQSLAIGNARYGIRANVIQPGLMNTPMAIEGYVRAGRDRDELIAERDARVPLHGGMGSAWDVANAALFLASDEARFITGVCLPVDGGQSARVG